jgi:hypothetical protein
VVKLWTARVHHLPVPQNWAGRSNLHPGVWFALGCPRAEGITVSAFLTRKSLWDAVQSVNTETAAAIGQ